MTRGRLARSPVVALGVSTGSAAVDVPRASIEDRPPRWPSAPPLWCSASEAPSRITSRTKEKPLTDEITAVETVLDNGKFGTRTVKFETGLLARQAAGSVTAYLDDETMLLSATTAGKQPKDQFDFFPLTIDVEERMYAVGQIPGSFFRSEGRPGEDAILTCRLIDRPLRPTFKKGLRNEVQVVITVLALDPDHPYDVLAINAASLSTQLSGLPFSGPVGGTRVALIDGQWVAFPTHSQLEDAVFDMVVAGRVTETGDVAIMMVEAEATEQTWNLVRTGAAGAHRGDRGGWPRRRQAVHQAAVRGTGRAGPPGRQAGAGLPGLPRLRGRRLRRRRGRRPRRPGSGADHRRQAGARDAPRRDQGLRAGDARRQVRGSREGARRRLPVAEQVAGPRARAARQGPHRRPRAHRHPHPVRRGRGDPARARLGAVRARRDPDPGCHHAEHADPRAEARHAVAGEGAPLHAQVRLPAVLHR